MGAATGQIPNLAVDSGQWTAFALWALDPTLHFALLERCPWHAIADTMQYEWYDAIRCHTTEYLCDVTCNSCKAAFECLDSVRRDLEPRAPSSMRYLRKGNDIRQSHARLRRDVLPEALRTWMLLKVVQRFDNLRLMV